MESLLAIARGASERFRRDDDAIDRLSHRYTAIILVICAASSTTYQLVGDPITCWAPKEFESSWITYMNAYCWVSNTYFLPFEEEIPKEHHQHDEIVYYQWIPFIFLGMAIFFYLPSVVWNSLNSKAGVDSDNILESAETFSKSEKLEVKDRLLRLITNQIDRFVGSTPKTLGGVTIKKGSFISSLFCGRKFGNYLVLLYTLTKILYIGNAFSQLFILNSVLETEFNIFGITALANAMEQKEFLNHTIFPKVTMCDFEIRALGIANTRRYTVQCLLPINLYTEKMFVFLWYWIVIVLFLTIISLITWTLNSAVSVNRYRFVENSLLVSGRMHRGNTDDDKLCDSFVYDYLRLDGVFVLRLIGHNTNKITCMEIIASVWDNWKDKRKSKGRRHDDDEDDEPQNGDVDTMPLKPTKPPKPTTFRPPTGPPPPPNKPRYAPLTGDATSNFSPPVKPSAPAPAQYNNFA